MPGDTFTTVFYAPVKNDTFVLPAGWSFVRQGTVYDLNDRSEVQAYGPDVPAWSLDGLRHEPQATNHLPNSWAEGAAAGSPGILPSSWAYFATNGISVEVVDTGNENGVPYVELEVVGDNTSGAATTMALGFSGETAVAAVPGQSWTGSVFFRQSGRLTHAPMLALTERNACGGVTRLAQTAFPVYPFRTVRPSFSANIQQADSEHIALELRFEVPAGESLRARFRIAMPQLEQGTLATSAIKTMSSATSRAASQLQVAIADGTYSSIRAEWMNEHDAVHTIFTESNPTVSGGIWTVAPVLGKRLRRFALAQELASPTVLTTASDIRTVLENAAAGASFILAPGRYTASPVRPASGITIMGTNGAYFDGADETYGWSWDGARWVRGGFDDDLYIGAAEMRTGYSDGREELFINGQRYHRVPSFAEVGPGKWFKETGGGSGNNSAYIGDGPDADPDTKDVRVSTRYRVLGSSNSDIVLRNIRCTRHASGGLRGVIEPYVQGSSALIVGARWRIVDCTIEWSHSIAVASGDDTTILRGRVLDNGQTGIHVGFQFGPIYQRSNLHIEKVEIARSNGAGFGYNWDSGAMKLLHIDNVTVKDCEIHHNQGRGIWFDTDVTNTVVENCWVYDNDKQGYDLEACLPGTSGHVVRYCNFANNCLVSGAAELWDTTFLIRESAGCTAEFNEIFATRGPAWRLQSSPTPRETVRDHVFRTNTIIITAEDKFDGQDTYQCPGSIRQTMQTTFACNENTYYADDNDDIRWMWHDASWDPMWISYPSLPPGAEQSSTFIIEVNPAARRTIGFLQPAG